MALIPRPIAKFWANLSSPDRAPINAPLQEPWQDLTKQDRKKLQEISREYERNDGILNRLLDLTELYGIGPSGLRLRSASGDDAWDAEADRIMDEWAPHADIGSRRSWWQLQKVIIRSWAMDGEIFIHLTGERDSNGRERPRVQLLEAHRCETPADHKAVNYDRIRDGVECDPVTGRATAYWLWHYNSFADRTKSFRRILAEFIVPFDDPGRPNSHRGIPLIYPVLNDLRDLQEWQHLEKIKLKDCAETSKVLSVNGGSANLNALRRRFASDDRLPPEQNQEDRAKSLQNVLGARTVLIDKGETYQQFQANMPADATQRFWDNVTNRICAGWGIPREVVLPQSIQGTMGRAEFDMANTFFRSITYMAAEHFARVRAHVLRVESQVEGSPIGPESDWPGDWRKYRVTAPRAINVDVGRNSNAMLAELAAGVTTREEIAGASGKDWRDVVKQSLREDVYIRAERQSMGLPEPIAENANRSADDEETR